MLVFEGKPCARMR